MSTTRASTKRCCLICLVNGIDGYRYLKALLVALPKAKAVDDFEALLPWRIALD